MAENDNSQEKTEEPTSKRLKDAKEKGQVARSKDLNATLILIVAGSSMLFLGPKMAQDLANVMINAFSFSSNDLLTNDILLKSLVTVCYYGFLSIIPLLFAILIASLFAPISLGGWSFSAKGVKPQFSRMNPLKGIKRMVSVKGFVEMFKSLAKFLVVAVCGVLVIKSQFSDILALSYLPLEMAVTKGISILAWSFIIISSALILISLIDVPFQLHQHNKQLKMTKQEVKDEYKETEGKPEVKGQIRKAQQEIARRRMIEEIPKADVILTNPTHYAVALSYDEKGFTAPVVLAKGKDFVAMQINKVANAHDIPILQIPMLARAIYFSTKLNQEIPQGLYVAVAQVLAYVFQLKRQNQKYDNELPSRLQSLRIPDEFHTEGEE